MPGFVTDVIGAVLLIPPTRRLARRSSSHWLGGRMSPEVANSLFGPRRVHARTGRRPPPRRQDTAVGEVHRGPVVTDSTPIEGEIIDPR